MFPWLMLGLPGWEETAAAHCGVRPSHTYVMCYVVLSSEDWVREMWSVILQFHTGIRYTELGYAAQRTLRNSITPISTFVKNWSLLIMTDSLQGNEFQLAGLVCIIGNLLSAPRRQPTHESVLMFRCMEGNPQTSEHCAHPTLPERGRNTSRCPYWASPYW